MCYYTYYITVLGGLSVHYTYYRVDFLYRNKSLHALLVSFRKNKHSEVYEFQF